MVHQAARHRSRGNDARPIPGNRKLRRRREALRRGKLYRVRDRRGIFGRSAEEAVATPLCRRERAPLATRRVLTATERRRYNKLLSTYSSVPVSFVFGNGGGPVAPGARSI